jgi:Fe-S cluster assembly iron-binding protein IscA
MIKVTKNASLAVAEYCQDKEKLPIRIYLKIGGCGIHSFGLVLEAAQPTDEQFEIDGYTYVIEGKLLRRYSPIKIDGDRFGFRISGRGIHPPTGCGTCGYGCGSRGGTKCTGVCFSCKTPCPTGQRIKARRKVRS